MAVIVSVLIPCYNSAGVIDQTVSSVLRQTLDALHVVVVDDGSTDGSGTAVRVVAGIDPRLRLVTSVNAGVAAARNRAFREADGRSHYLLFLDADDVLEPDMLAVMVDHLDRHPHVGMAYCGFKLIDAAGRSLTDDPAALGWFDRYVPTRLGVRQLPSNQTETPFAATFTAGVLLPSTTVIRRSVYEQISGWDESFGQGYEDADVFRQIAIRSAVHFICRPLVNYRRHSTQSSVQPGRHESQLAKLDCKWHDLLGLTEEQRRRVRAAEWFRDYRLAPYQGVRAGWSHLCRGRLATAARFFGGAARRYPMSLVRRP